MLGIFSNQKSTSADLKIEGMHCTGCSTTLAAVLKKINGVKKSKVLLDEGLANVQFAPDTISLPEIIEEIHLKTPYKVVDKTLS